MCDKDSYIKIDYNRTNRRGFPETIYCEGKSEPQLLEILNRYDKDNSSVLGTRCSKKQYNYIKDHFKDIEYNSVSKTIILNKKEIPLIGEIAICTAGASDITVAEEAADVAQYFGHRVERYYDIGIAGIHRLLNNVEDINRANVIIAIAGMDGALPGVIGGLVDKPVIAVPTSVGYGASFEGVSALLTMLNSCAEGVTVVNIDNGFGAAYSACQINRMVEKSE